MSISVPGLFAVTGAPIIAYDASQGYFCRKVRRRKQQSSETGIRRRQSKHTENTAGTDVTLGRMSSRNAEWEASKVTDFMASVVPTGPRRIWR